MRRTGAELQVDIDAVFEGAAEIEWRGRTE